MSFDLSDLMWLVIVATVLVVLAIVLIVRAVDRRRDRVRLSTDWHDDPLCVGEYVELPRKLDEGLR